MASEIISVRAYHITGWAADTINRALFLLCASPKWTCAVGLGQERWRIVTYKQTDGAAPIRKMAGTFDGHEELGGAVNWFVEIVNAILGIEPTTGTPRTFPTKTRNATTNKTFKCTNGHSLTKKR